MVILSQPTFDYGKIGYHNLFRDSDATVTASTEAAGFPKENLFDWRPFDWWKPTATGDSWVKAIFTGNVTADYFAFASHDLATQGATIKLQYSLNSGVAWLDATSTITPTENRVYFESFQQINTDYWRILVNAPTTVAMVGVASFGDMLTMTRGFAPGYAPGKWNEDTTYQTTTAENGKFLGSAIIRRGYPENFTIGNIDPGWIVAYWLPFKAHALTYPFFFTWDENLHADMAMFTQLQGGAGANYDTELTTAITLSHKGEIT